MPTGGFEMESDSLAQEKASTNTPIDYKRLPDDLFFEQYANNVYFEPSAWDLKLIFGKIDQAKGSANVIQHSAMTLSWSQVKIAIYFLQFHLAVHESIHGKVYVPKSIVNAPVPPTEDQQKDDPRTKIIFETINKLYRQFVEANPEPI